MAGPQNVRVPDVHQDQTLCWREVLEAAVAGLYPSEGQLERIFDRLEGTS